MRWTPLKISLLVVLSFSMALILSSFLFYKNINIVLGFWNEDAKASLYLKADALEIDKENLLTQLRADTDIKKIDIIDRTAAAADFKKMFGEYSAGLITVDEMIDLIPESLVIQLNSDLSTDAKKNKLASLKKSLLSLPYVEEFSYGGEWLTQFTKIDQALRIFGLTIFIVLSFAVCFISSLMVRSMVEDSRNEIEVYSLLGATRWLIYKKYLKQFLFFFSLSLILGVAITFACYYVLKNRFLVNQGFQFIAENLRFLSLPEIFSLLGLLFIFVLLGASLSLRSTIQRLSLFAHD